MTFQRKYKTFLLILLTLGITGIIYLSISYINKNIPDNIVLHEHNEKTINFQIPFTGIVESSENKSVKALNLNEPLTIKSGTPGTYKMHIKLFGILHYKDVNINVIGNRCVYVGGETIGIYLKSDGILVIDTGTIMVGGTIVEPSKDVLYAGDYIVAVNGKKMNSKTELINILQENGSKDAVLTIRRNGNLSDVRIKPAFDETGKVKLGIWVKDDCQGIGTLTYITDNGNFGALGHGICDSDTGKLIEVSGGMLYKANVLSIIKGKRGEPGEYIGTIDYSRKNVMGTIQKNTALGIYGQLNDIQYNNYEIMEAGYRYDAHVGKAQIRTSINNEIDIYDIEIVELNYGEKNGNKGIVFKVTDPDLLCKTNGIVQGQSGSPIIQDGKLVGAVTHVFVNDSTMGYGIFLETMLNAAN